MPLEAATEPAKGLLLLLLLSYKSTNEVHTGHDAGKLLCPFVCYVSCDVPYIVWHYLNLYNTKTVTKNNYKN